MGELLGGRFTAQVFTVDSTPSPDAGLFGSVSEVADCAIDTNAVPGGAGEVVNDCGHGPSAAGASGAERGDVEDRHHSHQAIDEDVDGSSTPSYSQWRTSLRRKKSEISHRR